MAQQNPISTVDLVLVTGLSGAGKTQALKVFRDLGYDVVDNLPLSLLQAFVEEEHAEKRHFAVGVDVTTRGFSADRLQEIVDTLHQSKSLKSALLFLDCHDEVLSRRFIETRYKHPLAQDRPVWEGLREEREILAPFREMADIVLDTSEYSLSELKYQLTTRFSLDKCSNMAIGIMSFSYKQGVPREADLVFDVRFLRNPHWDINLRSLTGQTQAVKDFIYEDPHYTLFFNRLSDMIGFLLPAYEKEGKSYLTIAIGCTGGKHRSVCLAEDLAAHLQDKGWPLTILHQQLRLLRQA